MPKVLIIGIDALDSILLSKFEKELPNFKKLKEESPEIKSVSVFPPDSDTAWATIHTGLNPAKHGIVYFNDPLDKTYAQISGETPTSILRGNTYWDKASKHGKRVCIIFPHMAYPVWPVNGIMVGRSPKKLNAEVQVYPESLKEKYGDLHNLNNIPGFTEPSKKGRNRYINRAKQLIMDEAKLGLQLLDEDDWDLFFIYSSVLDTICHNFWNYWDESDPTYVRDNPYKNVIPEFYKLYDKMIHKFMKKLNEDTVMIVLSDHGHDKRPTKLININEILRQKGFLFTKSEKNVLKGTIIMSFEKIKRTILNIITKYNLGKFALKIIKLFPITKEMYKYSFAIDWNNTMAYLTDLSGIKAYSYGGIKIIKENLKNIEYETLRSILINELSQLRDPTTGKKIVKWVKRREELYSGPYITKYPDIVFYLEYDYGAGNRVKVPLITTADTHVLVPGSHRLDTPVFYLYNLDDALKNRIIKTNITLMDIAPTVLDLLGIDWKQYNFEGGSIFG